MKKIFLTLLSLLLASNSWAAIAFVDCQSTNQYNNSPASVVSPSMNVTTGNALFVCFGFNSSGGDPTGFTVTDTAGNTFTYTTGTWTASQGRSVACYYSLNVTGNASDQVSVPSTFTGYNTVWVLQFSGIQTSGAFDTSVAGATQTGSGPYLLTSPTFSTSQASAVAIAVTRLTIEEAGTTYTAGTEDGGYTIPTNGVSSIDTVGAIEYNIFSSQKTGTTASISASVNPIFYGFAVMAFKGAADATTHINTIQGASTIQGLSTIN